MATTVDAVKEMALVPAAEQMIGMFERLASNKDVDVVKLQALIDMQKDIMAVNAKAAFNGAFAKMQAILPTVAERGRTDKASYAELEDIVEACRPVLAQFGFSLSHKTEWPDKTTVKVIGILTHEDGHARESEFLASADTSGSKNAIQALGSSVSYGRRYTTKDLLNIVTRREDDDGKKSERATDAAPEGYDAWEDTIDELVLAGCTRAQLNAKWEAGGETTEPFRRYIARTNAAHVEGWKKACKAAKS